MDTSANRYVPCAVDWHKDWAGYEVDGYQPTDRQRTIIDAVAAALAAGMFYSSEVRDFVAKTLGVTAEQAAAGTNRVEGGDFGMDCYYARGYLGAQKRHEAERKSWSKLRPAQGMELGTLMFNDFKRMTGVVVTGLFGDGDPVSGKGMLVDLQGKRGSILVGIRVGASNIRCAMDRASERKLRKMNFEEFVAQRGGQVQQQEVPAGSLF